MQSTTSRENGIGAFTNYHLMVCVHVVVWGTPLFLGIQNLTVSKEKQHAK